MLDWIADIARHADLVTWIWIIRGGLVLLLVVFMPVAVALVIQAGRDGVAPRRRRAPRGQGRI